MRAVRPWGLQLCHGASLLGDELLWVVYWLLLLRLQGLLYRLRRLRGDALLYRSRRRGRYLRRIVVVGKVLGVWLKLRLSLWLGLELRHWSMVLVRAVAERLLVLLVRLSLLLVVLLLLLLLLRMEVVHGGGVGVCLMRLRLDLGVGILRHRLHLGVLGRCRKEVGACLILLVANIRHRVPGSILLLLLLVRVLLVLVLLVLLLMLVLLMELLLLKLRLMLLVLLLRISRLRGHLLIAMATIGLPMARRLLAPVVHGGICHSRARCR